MKGTGPLVAMLVVILVVIAVATSSCSDRIGDTQVNDVGNRFVSTTDIYSINGNPYRVVYDEKTDIVYLATGSHGGLSALYGADGLPMTWDEYQETK